MFTKLRQKLDQKENPKDPLPVCISSTLPPSALSFFKQVHSVYCLLVGE